MNRSVGPIPPELSSDFRRARWVLEMSVSQAARLALISPALWARIEGRAQRPTAATLGAMALAVGLDPADTLARAGLDATSLPPRLPRRPFEIENTELPNIAAFIDDLRRRRDQDPPFDN